MKNKVYYKVVAETLDGKLFSWTSVCAYIIEYKVGVKITPGVKGTKLFVFDNFETAKKFAVPSYYYTVYKCKVENPSKPKYEAKYNSCYSIFWATKHNKKKLGETDFTCKAIKGTVLCDSVTLIEKIC